MAIVQKSDSNNILREDTLIVGQAIITIGAAVTFVGAIPTLEQGYKIHIEYGLGIVGSTSIVGGDLRITYDRPTGGNITKIDEDHITDTCPDLPDFYGNLPKLSTQANISNQTIEIYANGLTGYTLGWIIKSLTITRSY